MKFYFDTSIWRDYYEDRKSKFNFIGEHAFNLIKQIKERKDTIVYSDLVVDELKIAFDIKVVNEIFQIVDDVGLLEKINVSKGDFVESLNLSRRLKIPLGDCLHAILARKSFAIMVTRDKHFELLRDIVDVKKPEELI